MQVFVFYVSIPKKQYVFQKSSDDPIEPTPINSWSTICFRIQQVCSVDSTYIFMEKEQFCNPPFH